MYSLTMPSSRDDFTSRTKRVLAMRAGYVCSFEGCSTLTVGPSEEGPEAVTMLGVAAHICAAAPGGRRYDPLMSPAERQDIGNGIWLCQNHATIVDRDDVTFTPESLREMKAQHEAQRGFAIGHSPACEAEDLIALGPDVIALGTLSGISPAGWRLRIAHFIEGDRAELVSFISNFERLPAASRYLLVNSLGEGRTLSVAPSLDVLQGSLELLVPVEAPHPRTPAKAFGSTWAISPTTNDLFIENGRIASVSGIDAFAEHLQRLLGTAQGDNVFHPQSGSLVSDFFQDFAGSPWLERLVALEIIRLSAIPQSSSLSKELHTPLRAVQRVRGVTIPSHDLAQQRLSIRVHLDLEGQPDWRRDLRVFIYTPEQLTKTAARGEDLALAAITGWAVEALPKRRRRVLADNSTP